jgi:SAM-dependent methyltransferase
MNSAAHGYSGTDNLEVMAEARRYNAHLLSLVLSYKAAGDELVDFGAGTGTFAHALHDLGHRVLAVEPDDELRARIAARGVPAIPDLEAVPNDSLSYVYSLNVLEHIDDDLRILKLVHRKLRPGGRVMIYVPAFQMLYSSMDSKVGHFRRYTRRDLRERLTQAGLDIDHLRYVDFMGFFAALLFKAFDRGEGGINRKTLILFDRIVFPLSLVLDTVFCTVLGKNVLAVARRAD